MRTFLCILGLRIGCSVGEVLVCLRTYACADIPFGYLIGILLDLVFPLVSIGLSVSLPM